MIEDFTLADALRLGTNLLKDVSDSASLETQLIVAHITGLERPVILSHPERQITPAQNEQIHQLLQRRAAGVPLPYLLGEWEFYGNRFTVNPTVLIPRPETELLVEQAVRWLKKHPRAQHIVDAGTGSGCIAISVAREVQTSQLIATDISLAALQTAQHNAHRNDVQERICFIQADLLPPTACSLDLVLANLPYIPSETCRTLHVAHYEPYQALDGGTDGFALYRRLFAHLQDRLAVDGALICEIEYRQRRIALEAARTFFPHKNAVVMEDLNGLPRVLVVA